MGKKYPWQKWPDKNKKSKKVSDYHGQKEGPYWRKSSITDMKAKQYTEPRYNTEEEARQARKNTPNPEEFQVVYVARSKSKHWRLLHKKQILEL